jgi:hypothetical protein
LLVAAASLLLTPAVLAAVLINTPNPARPREQQRR